MAKVYARLIHKGKKTLENAPEKYREDIKKAYFELYGVEL